ncbi:MAG: NCS2 family permease, partial [Lachnospiraceae bacterium]
MLEKLFKLRENNTNIKTEVLAGLTTFMTMAYILAVNPDILSASGMDKTAVLMATSFAAFLGTLCMAFFANYPFALAPGMGLNAYFAFTVCGSMGVPWQTALFAVFVEGIIFIVLSLTNVRESLFNVIPATLKLAVSGGIGLFIAFIGLQDAGLVIPSESTLVTYIDFSKDFYSSGIAAVLSVAGVIITAILLVKKIKGSILFGIIITWILGMILELTGIFKPEVSVIPTEFFSFDISAIDKTFAACFNVDFDATSIFNFIVIIFSFLFVDLFDTLGTLIGVSS